MENGKNSGRRGIILILSTLLVMLPVGVSFTRPELVSPDPSSLQTTPILAAASEIPPINSEVDNNSQMPEPTNNQEDLPESGENSLLISIRTDNYYQLFTFAPSTSLFTQLTTQKWDIITPALSPDGNFLAFSSNQDGFWDLYILNIITNSLIKVTDTPQYDAAPTWSPDGKWLAYETYTGNNLEIDIISTVPEEEMLIHLTEDPAADHSPAWSPDGRYILFVSNRSGDDEIWVADLHTTQDRFMNMSSQPAVNDRDPVWSPDGTRLIWTSDCDGADCILSQEAVSGKTETLLTGSQPQINPDGIFLSFLNRGPQVTLIGTSAAYTGGISSIPAILPGATNGMVWIPEKKVSSVIEGIQNMNEKIPAGKKEEKKEIAADSQTSDEQALVLLEGINVPQPYLVVDVVADFNALHKQIDKSIGWNFMDNLENAFIPITQPASPQMEESWLYTGRAIAVNTSPLYGDWMCIVREDYNGQTYWRLFLKTRFQDGSQGLPIKSQVWDFTTRQTGDTQGYENGGSLVKPPDGYWVDFTAMAQQHGWNRIPALRNWRSYLDGALFNQFVHDDNLTWQAAMLKLYPPETLATPGVQD